MSAQPLEALASGGGRIVAPDVLRPKKKLKPAQHALETKKRVGWSEKAKARVAEVEATTRIEAECAATLHARANSDTIAS
jgi:hypothetical protein